MAVPSPTKEALREDALLLRRSYAEALWPSTRASLERQLAERVLPHLTGARAIAAYHPLRAEISPYPIVERVNPATKVGFPWFAERDSRFIWREGPADEPSPWGVLQPRADKEPIVPDIVLVPFVLADRKGTRIGHGKGHYDRALAHLRESGSNPFTIGLGWDVQIEEQSLPREDWDISLDAIATPKEWISCK
jgi:5-formyltetrahydrofolate cyclo-ligase